MRTLFPSISRYSNNPMLAAFVNNPVAQRHTISPTILNWRIPYIAAGIQITTEAGIGLTTESGDALVTE